jgi:hypothetical protein
MSANYKASHPTYAVMAMMAIKSIKSFSKGASRPAIKAYVEANNGVGKASNTALRAALTKLVSSGAVTQEGSRFMMSKVVREAAGTEKAAPKKKKASTKKVKAAPTAPPAAPAADDTAPARNQSTMPPKKLKVDMTALCLKHEALCREATRPLEEELAREEARHQAEMARLHTANSKAYNAQEASNKEELTAMQVDTAEIERTCPVCCTPQEGDFEKCKCGVE